MTKELFLMPGWHKPHWQLHVSPRDWSTPYFRIGNCGGMNFLVVQILCFSITRYWQ